MTRKPQEKRGGAAKVRGGVLSARPSLPLGAWGRQTEKGPFGGLKRDPLGYLVGANLFSYVWSNPLSRSDPTGLKFVVVNTEERPGWKLKPGERVVAIIGPFVGYYTDDKSPEDDPPEDDPPEDPIPVPPIPLPRGTAKPGPPPEEPEPPSRDNPWPWRGIRRPKNFEDDPYGAGCDTYGWMFDLWLQERLDWEEKHRKDPEKYHY